MNLVTASLVILLAASTSADVFYDRPCRTDVEVVQGFSVDRYLGRWYETQRYEQEFETNLDCAQAYYELSDATTVSVRNSAYSLINETAIEILGTAKLSFPDEEPLPAKLNVAFFGAPNDRSNYWVLDTDYENYSVVWSCESVEENRSRESFWLLSRSRQLSQDEQVEEKVNDIIQKYIDPEQIRITDQSEDRCPDFLFTLSVVSYRCSFGRRGSELVFLQRNLIKMQRYSLLLFVMTQLVSEGYGYIVKDGNCSLVSSDVPVVTNFDVEKYLGKWYEIERYEQDYQRNLECVTAEFTRSNLDSSLDVKSKGFLLSKDAYASFSGIAVMSDPTADPVDGKLNVTYGIKASGISNYWIVDTDYDRYAVVYTCTPIEDTESVIEGYWLYSRTPTLTEEPLITSKLQFLQSNYFVPSHVRPTNQSESLCRKEPELPPLPQTDFLPPLRQRGYRREGSPLVVNPIRYRSSVGVVYISGKWYEILRYDQHFEKDCDCGYATYTLKKINTLKVENCCKRLPNLEVHCSIGKAVVSFPDAIPLEAKLNVTFGGPPNNSNYWIMDTDYDNYAIIYSCKNLSENKSAEAAWVLSKQRTIKQEVRFKVDQLVDQYLVRSDMRVTEQSQSMYKYSQIAGMWIVGWISGATSLEFIENCRGLRYQDVRRRCGQVANGLLVLLQIFSLPMDPEFLDELLPVLIRSEQASREMLIIWVGQGGGRCSDEEVRRCQRSQIATKMRCLWGVKCHVIPLRAQAEDRSMTCTAEAVPDDAFDEVPAIKWPIFLTDRGQQKTPAAMKQLAVEMFADELGQRMVLREEDRVFRLVLHVAEFWLSNGLWQQSEGSSSSSNGASTDDGGTVPGQRWIHRYPLQQIIMYSLLVIFGIVFCFSRKINCLSVDGPCRNLPVEGQFNVSQYMGTWFEIKRYVNEFQANGECVTAKYTLNATSMEVAIENTMRLLPNQEPLTVTGRAVVANTTNGEAKLMIRFNSTADSEPDSSYWVLKTDYQHYAVVWSCRANGEGSSESAWILSRSSVMDAASKSIVESVIGQHLSTVSFRDTKQGDEFCSNATLPKMSIVSLFVILITVMNV
ncbi:uncharacterized protein LOC134221928 [Armigeres subalbatus]|uniref:uncharacterized protein LOC134221928 n=1 Tax=Armigeres subalbatus TaxID=124917 RepID=UPI002ED3DC98